MALKVESLKKNYNHFIKDKNLLDDLVNEAIFGYSEIKDFIKNNNVKSLLEIGCGTGILLNELKKEFPLIKMIGLEPMKSGYEKYKDMKILNSFSNFEIIENDIENLSINLKFDLIFSVNVLEHVNNWQKYLLKSSKYLDIGGTNIVLCPNYDFPYESHYTIPIIFNKRITKIFFNKHILRHEHKNNIIGHWEDLNFISKKRLKQFLEKKQFNYYFDEKISDRIFNRLTYDMALKKRHGLIGYLALFFKKLYIDKLLFVLFKVPFPYLKLIIKN
tara:strand:- start:599 stop:1420 length:822 start_codon:yes stop_codon:yes gene_type:complete